MWMENFRWSWWRIHSIISPCLVVVGPFLKQEVQSLWVMSFVQEVKIQLEGREQQSEYLCSAPFFTAGPLGSDLVNN